MSSETHRFWDLIDAILIINLKHRNDRWEKIYAKLEEFGVAHKAVQIEAVDGKTLPSYLKKPWFRDSTPEDVARMKAGSAGCCLSHRKALEYASEHGFGRILLMEDDALFRSNLHARDGEVVAQVLAQKDKWDMFYLGFYQRLNKHHVAVSEKIDNQTFELWRIRGPLMFHATVINSAIYEKLLAGLPTQENIWPWMTYWGSIDSWIYNYFGRDSRIKIWATMPKLVVQTPNYSDICGRVLSVEESEGSHRESKLVPLGFEEFERCIDLRLHERVYQTFKRTGRLIRARLLGYHKT